MPKHKKIDFKTTQHKIEGAGYVAQHKAGKVDLSSAIRFKNNNERHLFNKAIDLCIKQKESTNGIAEFMDANEKNFEEGEQVKVELEIEYAGILRTTLKDISSISTEDEFFESANQDSESHYHTDLVQHEESIRKIATHLFELNRHHKNKALFGKMMNLFAVLCSRSIHCEQIQAEQQEYRDKLADKIKAVNSLFKAGLVTGSIWSSSAFWNRVKSKLMLEYDLTPESTGLSPFIQTFQLLDDIQNKVNVKRSLYDSILYIFNELMVFDMLSGYSKNTDDKYKRRSISDKFGNLPEHNSEPGFDLFVNH